MHYFICYDVTDPKRLRRAERILSDMAQRVQDSLYVSELDDDEMRRMQTRLADVLDLAEDSVRIYPACERDRGTSLKLAKSLPEDEQSWVV